MNENMEFLSTSLVRFVEVRRTRRAQSVYPTDGDTSIRVRSPSPVRSSAKDSSWRDKLGAGDKGAQRDTLEVEKPSMSLLSFSLMVIDAFSLTNVICQ